MLRSLGQNPTFAELEQMVNEIDVDGNGEVHSFIFPVWLKVEKDTRARARSSLWASFKQSKSA